MPAKPQIKWKRFASEARVLIDDFDGSLREFGRVTGVDKATLVRMRQGKPLDPVNFLWICKLCKLDPMEYFKG